LSGGIPATILDFSPPQKHVLTACLWGNRPQGCGKAGGEIRTYRANSPGDIKAGARKHAGYDSKKLGQETKK
jgi:hypothetical protein